MYTRRAALVILPVFLATALISGAPLLGVDGDGASVFVELGAGTNPVDADTDDDGVPDGRELELGSDPRATDTDNDGLDDGTELVEGSSPTMQDTDSDGLTDHEEVVQYQSDPADATTVDNGLTDSTQVRYGLAPTSNPTIADINGTVGNIYTERPFNHQPRVNGTDSDSDGYIDRIERRDNPLDPERKDVVLRVHYMNGTAPNAASLLRVQQAYNDSPVDDDRGINLHVYVAGETNRVEALDSTEYADWYQTHAKRDNGMFYVLYANDLTIEAEGVSGYAFRRAPTFAVADDTQRVQTLTTAHELGHSLGLVQYPGIDSRNLTYKAYPSVMNYNSFSDCEYRNRDVCTHYGSYNGRSDWTLIEKSIENGSATPVGTYNTTRNRNN